MTNFESKLSYFDLAVFASAMALGKCFSLVTSWAFSWVMLAMLAFAIFSISGTDIYWRVSVVSVAFIADFLAACFLPRYIFASNDLSEIITLVSAEGLLLLFLFLISFFLKDEARQYGAGHDCKPARVYLTVVMDFLCVGAFIGLPMLYPLVHELFMAA